MKNFKRPWDSSWIVIEYSLFSSCNNRCDFCYQKNLDNFNIAPDPSIIQTQYYILETWIRENYTKYKKIELYIIGGELFFVPIKQYLSIYKKIFNNLKLLQNDINIKIEFSIGSNLLYKDFKLCEETLLFLLDNNSHQFSNFETSFDIFGRFKTVSDIDTFYKNLISLDCILKNTNVNWGISSTISKPVIEQFYNTTENISKYAIEVYSNIHNKDLGEHWWGQFYPSSVDFNYLNKWVPSAQELLDFWIFLDKNYEKATINYRYPKKVEYCCNGQCKVCRSGVVEQRCVFGTYDKNVLTSGLLREPEFVQEKMFNKLLKTYNCISCSYFNICSLRECSGKWNLTVIEKGDFCWKQKFYDYLEANNRLCEKS